MRQDGNSRISATLTRRKLLVAAAMTTSIIWTRGARTEPKKFVIGSLNTGAAVSDTTPFGAALLKGLAQRGYTLGGNLELLRRGADLQFEKLPSLIAEFTAVHADAVVCFGYATARAMKDDATVPVVSFTAGDPVGTGLVQSLAHPGGTITGISDVSAEITPKRLQYLKDMAPQLQSLAILYNATDPGMTLRYRAAEAGAKVQGIRIQSLGVREPSEFDQAFAAMNTDIPDAILMISDVLTNLNRKRVFEFANAHRLPAIYENNLYVRDGGLMSYGPDLDDSLDRVAYLIDRILRGSKPADLPFEQPTTFRLAINLKTAKMLNLTIPQLLLQQADEVVE